MPANAGIVYSPVAIHVRRVVDGAKTADQFRYLHRDPLDSIDTITDANMNVQERLSYGPFGQRRQANGQPLATQTRNPSVLTTKGYTGHEHLDQVTLINMNARLYDPITARFLSPDTLVPWPTYSQAHNRYIYVMNNPLKYNDPTGHNPANPSNDVAGEKEDRNQIKSVTERQERRNNNNDNGNPTVTGSAEVGGQVFGGVFGVSVSTGAVVDTLNPGLCSATTACVQFGLGVFGGAGVSGGVVFSAEALSSGPSDSFGVFGNVGAFGAAAGGSFNFGEDSAGGAKGFFGLGKGISGGVQFCRTSLSCIGN
jgi:RHS repeat-associated protein